MIDYIRENLSYYELFYRLHKAEKTFKPEKVSFGPDKDQYFLYYEPEHPVSDKIVVWVHGGGWNSGDPEAFDYVGQAMVKEGYRFVSLGYRLSPKNKYPVQIEDVCAGYNAAMKHLQDKGIDTSKVIVSGPSAGAHLSSILTYNRKVQTEYNVDISNVIGYAGFGGPYRFAKSQGLTLRMLLAMLFEKGYDRSQAEPLSLMEESSVPMLLIQSSHDGLIEFECAEEFAKKAKILGIPCEIYDVEDKKNTHSWYTAGCFFFDRGQSRTVDKFLKFIESL